MENATEDRQLMNSCKSWMSAPRQLCPSILQWSESRQPKVLWFNSPMKWLSLHLPAVERSYILCGIRFRAA